MKGTMGQRHSLKLKKTPCTLDITRHFFSYRVANIWNLLDEHTVNAPNLNAFKNC